MYEKTIFSLFDGAKVRTKYHLCKPVQQIAGFLQRIIPIPHIAKPFSAKAIPMEM
jgi:hypothetical protein